MDNNHEQNRSLQVREIVKQINDLRTAIDQLELDLSKLLGFDYKPNANYQTKLGNITNTYNRFDEEKLDFIVTEHLRNLEISPNLRGYEELKRGIILSVMDRSWLRGITKLLYPHLAKEFDTTSVRVERNIRTAIESSFAKCPPEILEDYFRDSFHKKKNGEFIGILTERIRFEYYKY